ncbi:MAG TPA: SDR family oxidoreductase [Casimicrobiaceae bacterium]|nr:SDR family oxidoreductase [Casimicrobiaceae bacterium]
MILIVGGTGVLGQHAARLLLAEGHAVRVMTREPSRAEHLRQQGAELVRGDLIDPASVLRACQGADRVLAAAHAIMGRGRYRSEYVDDAGHRALVDAAKNAGVNRFVYTSAQGASPDHRIDFFRTKYGLEQYLAGSGLEYVVLRPSSLMEWHAHELNGKPLLDKGRTILLGSGSRRRNFVAASDVARIAASALFEREFVSQIVEIRGPSDFTDDEVARLYAHLAGIPPKISHVPGWLCSLLGAAALPLHPGFARIMRMASIDGVDDSSGVTKMISYPPPVTGLEQFVHERVVQQLDKKWAH